MTVLWLAVLIAGITAMTIGVKQASGTLDALARHWGLPGTGVGALLGLATALPEITVGLIATLFEWPSLGLGAALGSNVPALPLVFVVAWASVALARGGGTQHAPPAGAKPQAVEVQVVPYLLVVALLALLTLLPVLRGLQPLDALVLVCAGGVYFARALMRPRKQERPPRPERCCPPILLGSLGIAFGGFGAVFAARRLADAFALSELFAGLFLIGFVCALPEALATWRLAREGKGTVALAAACSDGIVSLTIALIPPALVGTAIGEIRLYALNLAYLGAVLLLYVFANHRHSGQAFNAGNAALFGGSYLVYLVLLRWAFD